MKAREARSLATKLEKLAAIREHEEAMLALREKERISKLETLREAERIKTEALKERMDTLAAKWEASHKKKLAEIDAKKLPRKTRREARELARVQNEKLAEQEMTDLFASIGVDWDKVKAGNPDNVLEDSEVDWADSTLTRVPDESD